MALYSNHEWPVPCQVAHNELHLVTTTAAEVAAWDLNSGALVGVWARQRYDPHREIDDDLGFVASALAERHAIWQTPSNAAGGAKC